MPVTFQPLERSVDYLRRKSPVTSYLRTEGWERVAVGLRHRALWSAAVESARMVAFLRKRFDDVLAQNQTEFGTVRDRSEFIADWMEMAREEGAIGPGLGLADISSEARAELIYETNIQQAYGYSNFVAGQDVDRLDAIPAQELIRLDERNVKRNWHMIWTAAGGLISPGAGRLGDGQSGRLVALKSDPIWTAISRFGTPWPPFDFGSGVWVEDVLRSDAETLGIIRPDAPPPKPVLPEFNATLEASVSTLGPGEIRWLRDVFGKQIRISKGVARWVEDEE